MNCPLCGNQQASGLECDVCGRDLRDLAGVPKPPPSAPVPLMEGLEATSPAPVGAVRAERMPELQMDRAPAIALPRAPLPPEVEQNSARLVGDVPVQPMVDLTVDRVVDTDPRTSTNINALTCPSCGLMQAPDLACERCGLRLPQMPKPVVANAAPSRPRVRIQKRCRACGAPGWAAERCTDCGTMIPSDV